MSEDAPPSKYVVFKRHDWFGKVQDDLGAKKLQQLTGNYEVRDAVVIRAQDVFAASTFFNYSNQVQTTIEIMMGTFEEITPELGELIEDLSDTADHFHQLGVWASEQEAGFPD